jgi:hypothetical protein
VSYSGVGEVQGDIGEIQTADHYAAARGAAEAVFQQEQLGQGLPRLATPKGEAVDTGPKGFLPTAAAQALLE